MTAYWGRCRSIFLSAVSLRREGYIIPRKGVERVAIMAAKELRFVVQGLRVSCTRVERKLQPMETAVMVSKDGKRGARARMLAIRSRVKAQVKAKNGLTPEIDQAINKAFGYKIV